jgi:hypothetical protein
MTALAVAACGSSGGAARTASGSSAGAGDPLQGNWRTAHLTVSQVTNAFQAAGGSKRAGRAFFSQLGGGAKRFVVISIQFMEGSFTEHESADGGIAQEAYLGSYKETGSKMTLTSRNPGDSCVSTYTFAIRGKELRLRSVRPCNAHDGPYNTTLFASYPFSRG